MTFLEPFWCLNDLNSKMFLKPMKTLKILENKV